VPTSKFPPYRLASSRSGASRFVSRWMRSASRLGLSLWLVAALHPLTGCEGGPIFAGGETGRTAGGADGETASHDPTAAEAEAYARRVSAGLEALSRDAARSDSPGDQVVWLDERQARGGAHANTARDIETPSVRALREAAREPVATPAPSESSAPPSPAARPRPQVTATPAAMPADRGELLAALAAALARESGSSADRALRAAALSLLGTDGQVNEAVLAGMDRQTIALARGYAQLIRALAADVGPDGTLDQKAVADRLEAFFGPRELRIRRFELCRRVQSYGVFDPIESRSLLAGTPHRIGLYVELEHFASKELSPGEYEVKLQQEVELFNVADGLAVWKQPMVQIVDHSRNVRRDFFTWQVIELPPRLTVGRYILKVRVTDVHAQMISEDAVELQIVADPALARGK
jgi:hypothetical protein